MEQILPIGSIVEAGGDRLCILGARLADKDGRLVLAYMVARHPRGVSGANSVALLLSEKIDAVVFQGREGAGGKKYREGMEQFYGTLIGRNVQDAEELLQLKHLKKAVEERMEDSSDTEHTGG